MALFRCGASSGKAYYLTAIAQSPNTALRSATISGGRVTAFTDAAMASTPTITLDGATITGHYSSPNITIGITGFTGIVYGNDGTGTPTVKATITDPSITTNIVINNNTETAEFVLVP